ncbi:reprolysin-like metallopeptidase [Blastococcus sp. TBT05-19]|uniref:reprolysin-like metallopeptidase n=1 Tax=Blastococcus sp. TBT05-19 TaxID=2250581 RepID=UPI0011BEC179|nr:hypothetical protein [Blastococcus sp. TBT05-19]
MFAVRPLRVPRPLPVAVTALLLVPLVVAGPGSVAAEELPTTGDTVVGELVQAFVDEPHPPADGADGHSDDTAVISWVRTEVGETVRVSTEGVESVDPGSTVEVTLGEEAADEAADEATAAELEPALEVAAVEVLADPEEPETAPATAVDHPVTVVMLQPSGVARDSTTPAQVETMVNTTVADFWEQQTRGAVRFGVVKTVDWGAAATVGCDQPFALWDEAARRAGWTWTDKAHLLVYVPANAAGCSAGLGTIGSLTDGGLAYIRSTAPSVTAHEFGHNLGLGHASEQQCDRTVESGSCRVTAYADLYDVMGLSWEQMGTLNLPHAAKLGLLRPQDVLTVPGDQPTSVSATLAPVSVADPVVGVRAVELVDVDGTRYWLEYRQASGQDAWLGDTRNRFGLQQGVTLRRSDPGPDSSLLLDGTPSASGSWSTDRSMALPAGTPVRFSGDRFSVTVQGATASSATVSVTVSSPIADYHAATGGDSGPLGPLVTAESCTSGRCSATYQNGVVTWSRATGARSVRAPERASWESARDLLGLPVADRVCGLRDSGCFQHFQGGSLYTSASTGTRLVGLGIRARWGQLGWESGRLGYPVRDQTCGLPQTGCFVHFQGGSIYSSATGGVHEVLGGIRDRWAASGWERGALGYPISANVCGLRDSGCFQHFQGGSVYASASTGTRLIGVGIRGRWGQLGWENGGLGYPVGDQTCGLPDSGCFVHFQGGSVYSSAAAGAYEVLRPIRDRWAASGWERGPLGYPIAGNVCGLRDSGCFQHFQQGSVYTSASTGARLVDAASRAVWGSLGWENGPLGYPVTDQACGLPGGGCYLHFQGGSVYTSPAHGSHAVSGRIRDAWAASGWERGSLGYPVEGARSVPGGQEQRFQGGLLTLDQRTGQVRRS